MNEREQIINFLLQAYTGKTDNSPTSEQLRDQIINFLIQACDAKNQTIAQLQSQIAELQKQLTPPAVPTPTV